jgi:predicted negative regulator of RcsB-dependent stress response
MATSYDLQEQEQLDSLKAFWNRWGTAITALLLVLVLAWAGWTGWQWHLRNQGAKAAAVFDELDRAATAGDAARAARIVADLKQRFPDALVTQQGALVAAKAQADAGDATGAKATLGWAAEQAKEPEMRTLARLRLSALHLEARQPEAALAALEGATAPAFEALVADRRGDALLAQGKPAEARVAYERAFAAMDPKLELRALVEAKLTSLGAAPAAPAASAAASGAAAAGGAK